jgi:hypothetical protein
LHQGHAVLTTQDEPFGRFDLVVRNDRDGYIDSQYAIRGKSKLIEIRVPTVSGAVRLLVPAGGRLAMYQLHLLRGESCGPMLDQFSCRVMQGLKSAIIIRALADEVQPPETKFRFSELARWKNLD